MQTGSPAKGILPQTEGERQLHQRADVHPAARTEFSRAPASFRYAGKRAARAAAAPRGRAPGALPHRGVRAGRNLRILPGAEGRDRSRSDARLPGVHRGRPGPARPGERAGGFVLRLAGVVRALTPNHGTTLARIRGRVQPGQRVAVSGTLEEGLRNPRLFVTRPSGEVKEVELASAGSNFSARVVLQEQGEHSIEVLAEGSGGPQVAAIRRVFAGVEPPPWPPPEGHTGEGLKGVEHAIAQLRASHALPALQRDPELDATAEAHSREMARLRTFAHVLPTTGALGDRLRARGYAYRSSAENIGLSSDVGTAHEAIAGSPAHLGNLLDPRHRRLGLGAASGLTADGAEGVYLTEVFAVPIVGSSDPAGEVARFIERERSKRGLPPLQRDAALDRVADSEIRATALADQMKLDQTLTKRALRETRDLYSAVAELHVGSAPEELGWSKNLTAREWTHIGVGALYASSKQYGPGRLWVLLLYGR